MSEDEKRVAYLQIIESAIDRMGNNSAILKGFAATVIAGISAISFTEITGVVLLLSVLPVVLFCYLDSKYLQLEKKYRNLYEKVRLGQKELDFSMKVISDKDKVALCAAKATFCDTLKSWSIWAFYGPLVIIGGVIVTLKFVGII